MNSRRLFLASTLALAFLRCAVPAYGQNEVYLSDAWDTLAATCEQGWGTLGRNTAAAPTDGRPPSPLRVGDTTHEKGLGHHAPGKLVLELPEGEFVAFAALAGVHWQGGGRGSVVFQVFADGQKRFDSGRMTDSDAPQPIDVPLVGVRELALIAADAGDGISCDMANWLEARLIRDPNALRFGPPTVRLCGVPAPEPSSPVCGFSLITGDSGPQVASLGRNAFVACVREGEEVAVDVPVANVEVGATVEAEVALLRGDSAEVGLSFEGDVPSRKTLGKETVCLTVVCGAAAKDAVLHLRSSGGSLESLVRWRAIRLVAGRVPYECAVMPRPPRDETYPPRDLPALRPGMEEALVEWDWRMQDGIGTDREPVAFTVAIERTLTRGRALLRDLREDGSVLEGEAAQWRALEEEFEGLAAAGPPDGDRRWEDLWLRAHRLRRRIAFANPLAQIGPLLFVKRVPAMFSHQLTQYYGHSARPGGGLYVLDAPGESMQCRELVSRQLPQGSYMHPELSYDAGRVLFAFCQVPWTPTHADREKCLDRHYHLYEIRPDGSRLRRITDGPYDDFSPRELPNGELIFISTRRGGFHRCGRGPCNVYTLTLANADGSAPRTISYHETHEWDPAVLADGRVIYTRWDYVDRNAVHYQQLWAVRPDGTAPAAYYGNNTFSPVGVWEPSAVPGSPLVMATAAAHHAMTAGSIILLDTARGVDGPGPITRLTPDAPFPESETYVLPRNWHAPGSPKEYDTPEEARRWPGHCYRSPHPLSEKYFLAAYSFDPLIGEPDGNKANMFGLYLVDAFGNKELIYRDLNIAGQWPVPLRPRPKPPVIPSMREATAANEGVFFLQNIHISNPALPKGAVKRLRIVQVLPKTTPHANQPTVGLANASPGKQVLGTAPVEPDGSAYFRAPAGIPLCFQALDERGQAMQIMRSITYLQPGETISCVGCHEARLMAPPSSLKTIALRRPPSRIEPGPNGSNPLSYPLLVQPVLDKHCVKCHGGDTPAGPEGCPIVLTGEAEGHYSKSYNMLAKRVPFTAWGGLAQNSEPVTPPDRFGARASQLMKMLLGGHHEVRLDSADLDRLITWMDANALFYGTFDPEDQARQLRGERIQGPALE